MDDDELTTSQVASELGVHQTTVLRIPADRLPYRQTPGRHRFYRRADVDRYAAGLAPAAETATNVDERLQALEADVADLKAWREQRENR